MDKQKQAAAKREYKESTPAAGVYCIRNEKTGRMFVGSSVNVNARINRHKASLFFGSEEVPELGSDWKRYGQNSFTCEVLEVLEGEYDSDDERMKDLGLLEQMWTDQFARDGVLFYEKQAYCRGGVLK